MFFGIRIHNSIIYKRYTQNKKFISSQTSKTLQLESTNEKNWKLYTYRNSAQEMIQYDVNVYDPARG